MQNEIRRMRIRICSRKGRAPPWLINFYTHCACVSASVCVCCVCMSLVAIKTYFISCHTTAQKGCRLFCLLPTTPGGGSHHRVVIALSLSLCLSESLGAMMTCCQHKFIIYGAINASERMSNTSKSSAARQAKAMATAMATSAPGSLFIL